MWYPPATEADQFPTAALSTSGIRVEGDSFLSACSTSSPAFSIVKQKTGDTFWMPPVKNPSWNDFLRRHYPHQVKGSKFGYFLSACSTSSPVFVCYTHYIQPKTIMQAFSQNYCMCETQSFGYIIFPYEKTLRIDLWSQATYPPHCRWCKHLFPG